MTEQTTLADVYNQLMALGDQRSAKALSEQVRGRQATDNGEREKARLAHDHAWALRNQADGIWESAHLVRSLIVEGGIHEPVIVPDPALRVIAD